MENSAGAKHLVFEESIITKKSYNLSAIIGVVASLICIISFAYTFIEIGTEEEVLKNPYIIYTLLSILIIFSFLIIIGVLFYKNRILAISHISSDDVSLMLHWISRISDNCADAIRNIDKIKRSSEMDNFIKNNISQTMEDLKQCIEQYSQSTCGACIKMFNSKNEIQTLARDKDSKNQRDDENKKYSVDENTAFYQISRKSKQCFYHRNLEEYQDYTNQRPDYKDFYITTMVVPVKYKDEKKNEWIMLAILAIDSKKVGAFENNLNEILRILEITSSNLINVLNLYLDQRKKIKNAMRTKNIKKT